MKRTFPWGWKGSSLSRLILLMVSLALFCQGTVADAKEGGENSKSRLYFTRMGDKIHMRVGDRVFSADPEGEINRRATVWDHSQKVRWSPLLDLGLPGETSARLFSFRSFPESPPFLLVIETRPSLLKGHQAPFPSYVVFRHSGSPTDQTVTHLVTFSRPVGGGHYITKIDQVSPDETCVSFNLYTCWSCASHHPEKVLMDLATLKVKNIGRVSYFKWTGKGHYEYKDYVEKDCFFNESKFPIKCPEDPSTLPLKTGIFDVMELI